MNSQLTSLAASQHSADLLAAGARSRLAAEASPGRRTRSSPRALRHLRRRADVA